METYGWETEAACAVHLINYTNPNFRTTGSRQLYPVGDQKVRLTLPDLKPIKNATLLHSGQPLASGKSAMWLSSQSPTRTA